MDDRPPPTPFDKFYNAIGRMMDVPVDFVREKIVEPCRKNNKIYYYHKRFRRVPTIDECDIDDSICFFEANEQFQRDKAVECRIVTVLRERLIQCEIYYRSQEDKRCEQAKADYDLVEENWFIKYGDQGVRDDVRQAFMKQKHRMIWERRHGPVGSGMKNKKLIDQ